MSGASLLFLTNLVAIIASAFVVFLMVGMNSAGVDAEAEALRAKDPLAQVLLRSPVASMLKAGGYLRWRILMIVVVLPSVAVPLRTALLQVSSETVARGVVQRELRHLISPDAIVSQLVRIDPDRIIIRLISTQPVPSAKAGELRQSVERRTGRTVDLSVDAVASKSELADLMELIKTPPTSPTKLTPEEMQKKLSEVVQPAIQEIWPSKEAPIRDISLGMDGDGIVLNVRYEATADLELYRWRLS